MGKSFLPKTVKTVTSITINRLRVMVSFKTVTVHHRTITPGVGGG
jgi:hypothetical protein